MCFFLLKKTTRLKHRQQKKNKLNFIKIKNACASKNTTERIKRQLTEWENICTHISGNRLTSTTYKELLQFNKYKMVKT